LKTYSVLTLFLAILFLVFTGSSSFASGLVFIVNSQAQVSKLSVNEIKDYYYKRKRQWPDGTAVRFIDRAAGSELRKKFLSSILDVSAEDLDLFWIGQKLYTGDSAPLQQSSEALTLQLVANLKGAISYVSDSTPIPAKGVKILKVEDGSL
jgi:ABC-type phosphate transport system substrate-binding protein